MTATVAMPELEAQLHALGVEQKYRLMELLFADLQDEALGEEAMPEWHKDILEERAKLLEEGKTHFIPWEQAREEILREWRSRP